MNRDTEIIFILYQKMEIIDFVNNKFLSDCSIRTDEDDGTHIEIPCHKNLLCQNDYFLILIKGDFKKSNVFSVPYPKKYMIFIITLIYKGGDPVVTRNSLLKQLGHPLDNYSNLLERLNLSKENDYLNLIFIADALLIRKDIFDYLYLGVYESFSSNYIETIENTIFDDSIPENIKINLLKQIHQEDIEKVLIAFDESLIDKMMKIFHTYRDVLRDLTFESNDVKINDLLSISIECTKPTNILITDYAIATDGEEINIQQIIKEAEIQQLDAISQRRNILLINNIDKQSIFQSVGVKKAFFFVKNIEELLNNNSGLRNVNSIFIAKECSVKFLSEGSGLVLIDVGEKSKIIGKNMKSSIEYIKIVMNDNSSIYLEGDLNEIFFDRLIIDKKYVKIEIYGLTALSLFSFNPYISGSIIFNDLYRESGLINNIPYDKFLRDNPDKLGNVKIGMKEKSHHFKHSKLDELINRLNISE